MKLKEVTYAVIGSCMRVHSALGPGLLEACYHNALYYQLKSDGLSVCADVPFEVTHLGYTVGQYYADLLAAGAVIIEVKAVSELLPVHTAQLLNYLAISGLPVGLLVNFQGTRLVWRRFVRGG
jgi:GxxExxY protein